VYFNTVTCSAVPVKKTFCVSISFSNGLCFVYRLKLEEYFDDVCFDNDVENSEDDLYDDEDDENGKIIHNLCVYYLFEKHENFLIA